MLTQAAYAFQHALQPSLTVGLQHAWTPEEAPACLSALLTCGNRLQYVPLVSKEVRLYSTILPPVLPRCLKTLVAAAYMQPGRTSRNKWSYHNSLHGLEYDEVVT